MSVQTEISRLESAKEAIATAITGKGVTVPDGTMLDGMAALIESIEAGGGGGDVELQVAAGTFTPIQQSLKDYPITITGLPFQPKYIYIGLQHTSSVNVSSSTKGLIGMVKGPQRFVYQVTSGINLHSSATSNAKRYPYELNVNADGFTLTATNTTNYQTVWQQVYIYIAAG